MRTIFVLAVLFCFTPSLSRAADFAVPSDTETLAVLREIFNGKGAFTDRKAKRLGDKTLEVLGFVSMPGDFNTFRQLAPLYADWRTWTLDGINKGSDGGGFLLDLQDLIGDSNTVHAHFSFDIPFFRKPRSRVFQVEHFGSDKSFTIVGEAVLNEHSAVRTSKAFLKAFPAEGESGFIWMEVKALVQFKSWFLYEALPEKVVLREVGDRLAILAANYRKEEMRLISKSR